jgi:hypothetical protein
MITVFIYPLFVSTVQEKRKKTGPKKVVSNIFEGLALEEEERKKNIFASLRA